MSAKRQKYSGLLLKMKTFMMKTFMMKQRRRRFIANHRLIYQAILSGGKRKHIYCGYNFLFVKKKGKKKEKAP